MNISGTPAVVESARKRPLCFDPESGSYILYDEIANGLKKIIPLEKLSEKELIALSAERHLSDGPGTTVILTGQVFTKKQLAEEIINQTPIGKQMFTIDIEYLKYYLSQFPVECFEK